MLARLNGALEWTDACRCVSVCRGPGEEGSRLIKMKAHEWNWETISAILW